MYKYSETSQTSKIVFLISLMVITFVVLGFLSIQQLKKSEEIRRIDEKIEKIHLLSVDLFKTDVNFYRYDVISTEFFKTGKSANLVNHDSLVLAAHQLINTLSETDPFELRDELEKVSKTLQEYEVSFTRLSEKLRERGFKDFGLEGKLRTYAHELEDKRLLTDGEILMLRRHEKDFLLRHEQMYIVKFDDLKNVLLQKYSSKPQTLELIRNYTSTFHKLINVTNEIGMEIQNGLKGIANYQATTLINELSELSSQAELITQEFYAKSIRLFGIAIAAGVILGFILLVLIARKL